MFIQAGLWLKLGAALQRELRKRPDARPGAEMAAGGGAEAELTCVATTSAVETAAGMATQDLKPLIACV